MPASEGDEVNEEVERTAGERANARARMQDVARRVGVSTMTVSRALRSPTKVAPDTRARIETAIRELGYVPDLIAGSLSSGRSGVVAALVSTLANSVFAETIDGLTEGLRRHGYHLLLGSTEYSATEEEALVLAVLGRRPDGLMLSAARHTDATRAWLERAGLPIVETWELPDEPLDMAVGFSNFEAGRAMTRALHGWGYRRIAFVGGEREEDTRGRLRREGYLTACAELGLEERVIVTGKPTPMILEGAAAIVRLLDDYPETQALFCMNDVAAAGALAECRRRGLAVPDQLAIAGFGDFEIAGEHGLEITTVRIPKFEIGMRAAQMLVRRLRGEGNGGEIVDLGFEVIRRRTA